MTASEPASRRVADARSTRRAVVIGGGIAGLATAALLGRDGYQVDVLEQRRQLGGRVGSWTCGGYRFDTGPSWLLMPEVFERFFAALGTSTEAMLDLVALDPAYRVYFAGHPEPVEIAADPARNLATFERIEPGAGSALADYLRSAEHTYQMALAHFLYTSYTSMPALLGRAMPAPQRVAPLLLRSLHAHVAARFSDRRLRQILGYPAVFLGSSPRRTPSMYHLMSALDLTGGVRYPLGGFIELIDAVAALAREHGVRIRTGCTVTAITTEPPGPRRGRAGVPGLGDRRRRAWPGGVRARATGVTYRDDTGPTRTLDAEVVVAATDLHHLEHDLLPAALRDFSARWWRRHDPGPGGVLAYLGVQGHLPQLRHHTLMFTEDWDRNFAAIRSGEVPRPASAYVCAPSRTDPSVAPPEGENLFLLIPVPADAGIGRGGLDGEGDAEVERIADEAISMLAGHAGIPDLHERIRVRRTVGPADFADDLNAWRGSLLGPAHTLRQSAFFRAGNASRHVRGLYRAGAGTIPGVGLPMCLISAEVVTERIGQEMPVVETL